MPPGVGVRFSKRLVTACHTHAWYNMSPLNVARMHNIINIHKLVVIFYNNGCLGRLLKTDKVGWKYLF